MAKMTKEEQVAGCIKEVLAQFGPDKRSFIKKVEVKWEAVKTETGPAIDEFEPCPNVTVEFFD